MFGISPTCSEESFKGRGVSFRITKYLNKLSVMFSPFEQKMIILLRITSKWKLHSPSLSTHMPHPLKRIGSVHGPLITLSSPGDSPPYLVHGLFLRGGAWKFTKTVISIWIKFVSNQINFLIFWHCSMKSFGLNICILKSRILFGGLNCPIQNHAYSSEYQIILIVTEWNVHSGI